VIWTRTRATINGVRLLFQRDTGQMWYNTALSKVHKSGNRMQDWIMIPVRGHELSPQQSRKSSTLSDINGLNCWSIEDLHAHIISSLITCLFKLSINFPSWNVFTFFSWLTRRVS
jgi:hypothetical protein